MVSPLNCKNQMNPAHLAGCLEILALLGEEEVEVMVANRCPFTLGSLKWSLEEMLKRHKESMEQLGEAFTDFEGMENEAEAEEEAMYTLKLKYLGNQDQGQDPDPDKLVERIENKSAVEVKQMSKSQANPQRPAYGVEGRKVVLWTNHFNLCSLEDLELYRYSISIATSGKGRPPAESFNFSWRNNFLSHKYDIATDFKANLISRNELDLKEEDYIIVYRTEEEDSPTPNAAQFRLRLQFTGSLTLSTLLNHLTSTQTGFMFDSKDEIIRALNIVLGHYPMADPSVTTIATSRHFSLSTTAQDRMSLGAGLQVVRGFFMSVRAATARILVNVQVKNMAFYDEGPLDKIMMAHLAAHGQDTFQLLKFVKRLVVDAMHIKKTNSRNQRILRLKTVQGFAAIDDGRNLAHPPIVPRIGAGAQEVQFFLDIPVKGSCT
ncbi:hypothetical protein RRF57_005948 [Xylaria bambusicola]|uniref:Argonaute linker 1 domain-containing protein n=1 Tax=Xylaria bambusicola TaxID=326684 RepID=A0AAN7Z8E1_9PEZI